MEVIKNQKGGQKVCFDGYMYNKHISKVPVLDGDAQNITVDAREH